jgi:hypothetical protein
MTHHVGPGIDRKGREIGAPHTVIALARAAYGIAVVPSTVGILLVTFAAFRSYSVRWLSGAGCGSHGNLSGSCPFTPNNSSTNSGGIASESTPVESLTGALRRCFDQGSQCSD